MKGWGIQFVRPTSLELLTTARIARTSRIRTARAAHRTAGLALSSLAPDSENIGNARPQSQHASSQGFEMSLIIGFSRFNSPGSPEHSGGSGAPDPAPARG